MKVRLTRRAIADIHWIADGFRDVAAARKTEQAIRDALELLSDYPGKGRFRPHLGVYAAIVRVRRRSYTIYYRMTEDSIAVAHIRDGRRKPVKPGEV
jgi:plasmid stabilization system protein ParE